MNNNLTNLFSIAGLSAEQAKIYEILLGNQDLPARAVARLSNIERSLTYKVLNQLIGLGLASKEKKPGKIETYKAEHPNRLLEISDTKRNEAENAYKFVGNEIGSLVAKYNLTSGKPGVQFLEGAQGIRILNKDIIAGKENIKLIRSSYYAKNEEIRKNVKESVQKRVSMGLKTKIIGNLPNSAHGDIEFQKKEDRERLTERRIIEDFDVPTQIIIYGNKVSITDFKNEITTIIENESVRQTFDKIFDFMFEKGRQL